MTMLVTSADSSGAPSWRASALSGSSTGSVASLAPGAVAHSPVKAGGRARARTATPRAAAGQAGWTSAPG